MRVKKIKVNPYEPVRLRFKANIKLADKGYDTFLDVLLTDTELHIYDYGSEWQPNHNMVIQELHILALQTRRYVRRNIMKEYYKTHTIINHTSEGVYTRPPTNDYRDSDTILAPIFFEPRKENE